MSSVSVIRSISTPGKDSSVFSVLKSSSKSFPSFLSRVYLENLELYFVQISIQPCMKYGKKAPNLGDEFPKSKKTAFEHYMELCQKKDALKRNSPTAFITCIMSDAVVGKTTKASKHPDVCVRLNDLDRVLGPSCVMPWLAFEKKKYSGALNFTSSCWSMKISSTKST